MILKFYFFKITNDKESLKNKYKLLIL